MKKNLLAIIAICLFTSPIFGQTTLPNLDLESWTTGSNYDQPDGEWTTANKIVDLLPGFYPPTTFRVTDAHSGTYAAKMETDMTGFPANLLVTGTLAIGEFDVNATPPNNLKMGAPFTGRPDKFSFWYKSITVNGDSIDAYCLLSKWNGSARDTIGYVGYREYNTVSTYTLQDLSIAYQSSDTPDSITIIFASSSDGKNFNGQVGNTIWVDDVGLEYASGIDLVLMPEAQVTVFPNPTTDIAGFSFSKNVREGRVDLLDMNGKMLKSVSFSGEQTEMNVSELASGTYFYRAWDGELKLNTGFFVVE